MTINITVCHKTNVTDSCAVWNILSSLLLYRHLDTLKFEFPITRYVQYECLKKEKKTNPTSCHIEMQKRLKGQQEKNKFSSQTIAIADLQDENILKYSKQLGIGELSSIAFAKKVNMAFLTDDQMARKIAQLILGNDKVQTTAQLVGFLFYEGVLTDSDLDQLLTEHKINCGPLEKYFREVHLESLRIKTLLRKNTASS